VNPRQLAVSLLARVAEEDAFAQDLLDRALADPRLGAADRGLLAELVYGSIRHRLTLDSILERFSRTPLERLDYPVHEILRTALYQIVFLDRIPPAAAVNEAVQSAKALHFKSAAPFVNAVLRNVLRDIADRAAEQPAAPRRAVYRRPGSWCNLRSDVLPSPDGAPAEFIARSYSHPQWLVERWLKRFGREEATAFCRAGNAVPATIIRVNSLRTSATDLLARFSAAGVWAEPGGLPAAIRLPGHVHVEQLPGFAEGLFTVQDEGAMQVAPFLSPRPGQRALDLCAAPGGKTTHLAELMRDEGTIVAVDISVERMKLVEEGLRRLGLKSAQALVLDAARSEGLPEALRASFDAVLLDAPCSNTGVLSRRPEARWRLDAETVAECARRQRDLLRSAASAMKSGAALVYSTCAIEPEENDRLVRAVLAEDPKLRLDKERLLLPSMSSGGGYMARIRAKD
jgi:16S rRNA (cytosine967-C5)-methyltransferase